MNLVERHIISKNHKQYKAIDHQCFLSKNLYNSVLYTIKKYYEETGKTLRYNELEKMFKTNNQPDYRALNIQSSQQIMMLMDRNIKSYFALIKKWKKDKKSLNGCPQFPKYKHKTAGRNILVFNYQQLNILNQNEIRFPKKTGLTPLKTKVDVNSVKQVRIIPQSSCYIIEVVYEVPDITLIQNVNKAAIDLGLNNLATITFNNNKDSFIFNGKPLKAINQYYNKKKAAMQSDLEKRFKRKSSKKLNKLTLKRNNKVKDYLHKTTKKVVDKLKENNISQVVVGHNKEWKQEINLGSKNNQNFCSIPFEMFIGQLKYKCQLQGIEVLTNEESYTSKCSALDLEVLGKKEEYLGKRVYRGQFRTVTGIKFNADVNGSLNIGRKVFGDEYVKVFSTNKGYVYYPIKARL